MINLKFSAFCFCFMVSTLCAQYLFANAEIDNQYKSANQLYNQSKYSEAIKIYEQLLEKGFISDDLFANMGNAYLKDNSIGQSILNYEKALLINSGNIQANQNLLLAKESIINPVTQIPDFFAVVMWRNLVSSQSTSTWIILHLVLLLTVLALAMIYWTNIAPQLKGKFLKSRFTITGFIGLVILSTACLSAAIQRNSQLSDINYGIVMSESSSLLDGPDERSNEITLLSEGLKAKILDQIVDWYKIELEDKDVGWLEKDKIELITIKA